MIDTDKEYENGIELIKRKLIEFIQGYKSQLTNPKKYDLHYQHLVVLIENQKSKLRQMEFFYHPVHQSLDKLINAVKKNSNDCSAEKTIVLEAMISKIYYKMGSRELIALDEGLAKLSLPSKLNHDSPSDGSPN